MSAHAILSASAAHRWMHCPPSARLCAELPDQTSTYAMEGTDAHALCEYKLRELLQRPTLDPREDLAFYNKEMEDCAEGYASFIAWVLGEMRAKGLTPTVWVEQRLDFSQWVPQGFGTGDCVILTDDVLHIIDYKHGAGVTVEAEGNPQMMLYALGALHAAEGLYEPKLVRMTIYQPRRENISTAEMATTALLAWGTYELRPIADKAFAGEGELQAGDWCRFCKLKATCRKRAELGQQLAAAEFRDPPTLTIEEISELLPKLDGLADWIADLKNHALDTALKGTHYPGWKLVAGRSNRKYINDEAAAKAVEAAGYDPWEKKVLGITAMEKRLGKAAFAEVLDGLVEKPAGKPTLVPESDKRPPLDHPTDDFNTPLPD